MQLEVHDTLSKDVQRIREIVFVEEQGFHDEFDEIDIYAKHLVLYDNKVPIATCRFFIRGSKEEYIIGRIAVIKQYRGKNIGSYILKEAEAKIREAGGKEIFLHAQNRVKRFYEKHGYSSFGEIDLDENCPHIWMHKEIGDEL